MGESEETPEEAVRRGRGKWMMAAFGTVRAKIVGACIFLAAVATLLTYLGIGPLGDNDSQFGTTGGDETAEPLTQSPGSSAAVSTHPAQSVESQCGDLVNNQWNTKPCDSPHSAETIPVDSECGPVAFIRYAGGNPSVEVLRSDIKVDQVNGACIAQVPGLNVQESYEGFLNGSNGPALRECRNAVESFVPCHEEHTGEVVFREDPTQPQELSCEARASEYMNSPVDTHFRDVNVEALDTQPRRCVVEVRGRNTLETSLRNLGSDAIQLGSGA